MTAMIDVTFLLLTYFLLTTTFRQAEGQLPGTLPGDGPVELNIVRVDVRAVGENCQSAVYSIVGQNKPIRSPRELVESLRAQGRGENTIVEIQAGRAVRWRYVVEAYNQAAAADFKATMRI
jgi:biopolymer transport protein ExbD